MPPKTREKAKEQSSVRNTRATRASSSNNAAPPAIAHVLELTTPQKCEKVLQVLSDVKLSFGEFVNAVCYGDEGLRQVPLALQARSSLYSEGQLVPFLKRCLEPPRPPSNTGPRPVGGSKITANFVFDSAQTTFAAELKAFSAGYKVPDRELADRDYLETITSASLYQKIKSDCPRLCTLLTALTSARPVVEEGVEVGEESEDEEGPKRPPAQRHPHFDIVFQVTSMAYRMNPHRNVLQKVLTIYMQAKHTGKAVFDLLQQAGISMSYWWVRHAISNLSVDLRNQAILAAHTRPILLVHDNIRLKYGVRSQRGDNQSVTDNGTAATLIVLPESARAFERPDDFGPFLRALRDKRIAKTAPRLCWEDLDVPARRIFNDLSSTHDILDHFRLVPGLAGHKIWKSEKLQRPIGPQQLPHGREHRLEQYMLGTTNIDESSYSGNSQVIPYVLRELKLDESPQRDRLMLERLIPWVGDQMTAQRCRQVRGFRQESINGIVRWDPLLFTHGGLHSMMTLGQSILDRYRGTTSGPTFASDIIRLSRTGLEKVSGKKRLDFHDVDEFLLHNCEAHITGLFYTLCGCKTEEEVIAWADAHTADDLFKLASDVLIHHASTMALDLDESDDQVRRLVILRQRELLLYYSVRRAYRHGDVDRIEALLPELLFYFIGSGNGNYAKEAFELLQLLTHECTPDIRAAILKHALVVNKLGRADSFYPIDQRQEFNNAGIRDYGPPPQSSSWQQYHKISSVIPLFMDVVEHVEHSVTGLSRSHIHKNPAHEKDVKVLIANHLKHKLHEVIPGRTLNAGDKVKDCYDAGVLAIRERNVLSDYHDKRDIDYTASWSTHEFKEDVQPAAPAPTASIPSHPPTPTSQETSPGAK
ncbi:hypothetical protein FS749_010645 [Ceratobasidium sp. UAMH 11750]|nr:hypothetical protein FS749_010645 [Ceratobasidium sp. UAMH 11750]